MSKENRRRNIRVSVHLRQELKRLVSLTKDTDSFYLNRRNISEDYDPVGKYDFDSWRHYFDSGIRATYESLHKTLL